MKKVIFCNISYMKNYCGSENDTPVNGGKYIEENNLEIAGEIREKYIDGVWNKEDESEWLSEIQIPVRKTDCQKTIK